MDNKYTNMLQKKIKSRNKPGDVLYRESKLISKEIKRLEKNMKEMSKIIYDDLKKLDKKDSVFTLNNDGVLDHINIPTINQSPKFKTLEILTKYAKVNIKLNLISKLSEKIQIFDNLSNWLNGGYSKFVINDGDSIYKIIFDDGKDYRFVSEKYDKGDGNYQKDQTGANFTVLKNKRHLELGLVLLSMLVSIKNFNITNKNEKDANKIASRNLFKLFQLGKVKAPVLHIELKNFTINNSDVKLYEINKQTLEYFLDDLNNNSDKMKNNSNNLKEYIGGENIVQLFTLNIEQILIKDVEYGIFEVNSESKFIKSKKEYVSYISRLLVRLKQRQQMLKSIESLPKLFKERLKLEGDSYEQQLDIYIDEMNEFKNDKITKQVVIKKNSNLVMNDLKEDFDMIVENIKNYNQMKKRVQNINKYLKRSKKMVTDKDLAQVQDVVAGIEYIKYDITYYVLLMKKKLYLLKANKKYKPLGIKVLKISSRLERIIPVDIKNVLKKYAKSNRSFSNFLITDISHSSLTSVVKGKKNNKNNNGVLDLRKNRITNINNLKLVSAFNNLNSNLNKNVKLLNNNNGNNSETGMKKNAPLTIRGRMIFIPYVRTVGGFIKEYGLLNLSDLFNGDIKMYNKVTMSTIKRELYDRSYLILNAHTSKLNEPLRWKILNFDKVKTALTSKKPTLIKRTIYRLLTNSKFYTQKTETWESGVDNVKSAIIKFCKATSSHYGRCDYVMSLEDLDL